MLNIEKSDNYRKNQPLDNLLFITEEVKELLNIIEDRENGFQDVPSVVVLKRVSEEKIETLTKKIAADYFNSVISGRDKITNIENNGSIRNSSKSHPFHSDGSFERKLIFYFSLYFKQTDDLGGGATILKSSKFILRLLDTKHIETLIKHPVLFTHKDKNGHVDNSNLNYAIRNVNDELFLTYSQDSEVDMSPLWTLSEENKQKVWDALEALNTCVSLCPQVTYHAQRGDFIFFYNYGVLHGREKILSLSPRIIWRNYFGVKEFFKGLDRKVA